MKFEWNIGVSGTGPSPDPVYIHFDFDNFQPDLMVKENDKTFVIWRMIPPGRSSYFFTFDGEPKYAKNHKFNKRKAEKIIRVNI
jgi:hypothetical protein